MSKNETAPSITEQIDNDEGLKSKRKMLIIVSLITLALTFADAKIEEVNTFIFKLSFGNNGGITFLLVCSIVVLLIRYFTYARPYHEKIYKLWSGRMLQEPFFYHYEDLADAFTGLVVQKTPENINFDKQMFDPECSIEWGYECSFFLTRKISYRIGHKHDDYQIAAPIGWKNYPKTLFLELKYQFESYFIYRENLDIYAPYLIGLTAIFSYFFVDELQHFLNVITSLTSR
jgi:hypothetical protein